jgi:hypothetical protein
MIVIFFTLLNFFLAIVVDAFILVKSDEQNNLTEMGFASDIYDVFRTRIVYRWRGWPRPVDVINMLSSHAQRHTASSRKGPHLLEEVLANERELLEGQGASQQLHGPSRCTAEDLMEAFPDFLGTEERVAAYIGFYYRKCKFTLSTEDCHARSASRAVPTQASGGNGWDLQGTIRAPARLFRPHSGEDDVDWEVEALMLAREIVRKVMKEWHASHPSSTTAPRMGEDQLGVDDSVVKAYSSSDRPGEPLPATLSTIMAEIEHIPNGQAQPWPLALSKSNLSDLSQIAVPAQFDIAAMEQGELHAAGYADRVSYSRGASSASLSRLTSLLT